VSPLAETQAAIRGAVVDKDVAAILPRLTGGVDPTYRLSIHQRHYEASLLRVLRGRFPAIEWLVGGPFMIAATSEFARRHPPQKPCLAEYGADFARFLAERPGNAAMPWLSSVAELEWHVGAASVAIDEPAIGLDRFAEVGNTPLDALTLRLQPGLAYIHAAWPVDKLVKLYVGGKAPEQLAFDPNAVWLEVHGARGNFVINRLDAPTHAFRAALAGGRSIAAAIGAAGTVAPTFDPGAALAQLFADGLVTAITAIDREVIDDRN
jgi:hypothetical protein